MTDKQIETIREVWITVDKAVLNYIEQASEAALLMEEFSKLQAGDVTIVHDKIYRVASRLNDELVLESVVK